MKRLSIGILTILLIACRAQYVNRTTTSNNGSVSSESVEISENTARAMVYKYHPHSIGFRIQTRTVWLSKDRIKLMYDELQKDSAIDKNRRPDGLRIYLARYPKYETGKKKYDYALHNTMVFVSTKDSVITISKKNSKDTTIHAHWDYTNGTHYAIKHINIKNINKVDFIQNKGELTPPGDEHGAILLQP